VSFGGERTGGLKCPPSVWALFLKSACASHKDPGIRVHQYGYVAVEYVFSVVPCKI
jgi:hypothetical protein